MFYTLLVTLSAISLAISVPINILKTESDPPYDVEYVPVEVSSVSTNSEKSFNVDENNEERHAKPIVLDDNTFKALQNFKNIAQKEADEDTKRLPVSALKNTPKVVPDHVDFTHEPNDEPSEDRPSVFDLFEDRFNSDPSRSSEDFVLVPISALKKLQDDSSADSSQKTHVVAKRQAPGNDFLVYRPVVQYRKVFRNRQRLYRPPAFVGYMNDYDNFPTVA